MTEINYSKLGFKAGLEIHQQLDTGKLFSRAKSILKSDGSDYIVKRKLHAVAGEGGKVDEAVKYESGLDNEFIYEVHHDSVGLVELDEEPPHEINSEALDIVLQVAFLLNCEVYQNTQIMRKTVVDGSNTSGFQRTVLIAHSGFIETSLGRVGIDSVALEEDSARLIKKEKNKVYFNLDRLGIPLVEIATAPDLKSAEHVKECALKLGEILRACKVKRGIGTIRQDVNVSIEGHDRVEIKGFQDPKMMIKTVDLEIERQKNDLSKKNKVGGVRNALLDGKTEFLRPMPGRARMYPETDLPLLKISLERINKLKKNLPKLRAEIKGILKKKGLSEELSLLVLQGDSDEFLTLMKVYDKDADLVGKMVSLWRNEFGTKLNKNEDEIREILNERVLEKILEKVKIGELSKGDVKNVMLEILEGKNFDEAVKIEKIDEDEIEKFVRKIVKEKPGLRDNAYMGMVMKEFKGKVDAKRAMEILKKIVK